MLTYDSSLVDPTVLGLARELRARGLLADVQVLLVCGDPDVRLVACRTGGEVSAELLARFATEPAAGRWHAVRVHGDEREVWRGPPHHCAVAEVACFVEALLEPVPPDPARYPLLG